MTTARRRHPSPANRIGGATRRLLSGLDSISSRRRSAVGFGAGLLTAGALPPWGWWPLAFIGLAIVHLLLDSCTTARSRFGLMWFSMLGFFVPGLAWMIDLTPPGYIVSVPILAAIMAVPIGFTRPGPLAAAGVPAAIMHREPWHRVIPFGGVPMSSLAKGQVGGPLLAVARAFGALGVVVVLATGAVAVGEAILGRRRAAGAAFTIVVVAIFAGHLAPDGTAGESVPVAVVQGGGQLGTRAASSDESTVFERHLVATESVEPGTLVIWPESAVSADHPFEQSRQFGRLAEFAQRRDITILTGLTERLDADFFSNAAVVITPDGELIDRYEKVHLVPFGEYIPLRSLIDPFADLSLIPRTAVEGTGDARVDTPHGPVVVAISFEIYFGERTRDGVAAGGEIIVNPTLASSYRTTHVPEQSLASARLRAVESGRWVLQSSTTGYSAIVDPSGRVVARTGLREARALSADIERRTGRTWPVRSGKVPITVVALVVLGAGFVVPLLRDRGLRERGLRERGLREHGLQERGLREHGLQEHDPREQDVGGGANSLRCPE